MMRFAARAADIVGFVPRSLPGGGLDPAGYSADSMDQRVGWVDEELSVCGRDDGGPERSALLFEVASSAEDLRDFDGPDGVVETSPHLLLGDVPAMVDALEERRQRWGITYHVCFDRDASRLLPVVAELAN